MTNYLLEEHVPFVNPLVNHHLFLSMDPRKSVDAHWHADLEITYWKDCGGTIYLNHGKQEIHPNDIILINSGDLHELHPGNSDQGCALCLIFNQEFLSSILPDFEDVRFVSPRQDPDAQAIFEQLLALHQGMDTDPFAEVAVAGLCMKLLYHLLHHFRQFEDPYLTIPVESLPESFREMLIYIRGHLSEIHKTEDVCDRFFYSRAHFSRIFQQYVGHSFHDYLIHCRIEAARAELICTEKPLADIAFDVGFKDARTLNKHFSAVYDISPAEYRKKSAR